MTSTAAGTPETGDPTDAPPTAVRVGAPAPAASRAPTRAWWHLEPVGVVVAALLTVMSMTPSLIPRDWLFQGIVSGVNAAAGYGVGVGGMWLVRRWHRWPAVTRATSDRVPARARPWLLGLLGAACVAAVVAALVASAGWQREVAQLMGMERTTTSGWFRAGPLLLVVAVLLLALARGGRRLSHVVAGVLRRWLRLPRVVARAAGGVLVAGAAVLLVNDVLVAQALSAADNAFSASNDDTEEGVTRPTESTRSGGPGSLVSWESLGREGRSFVAGGRDADALARASGTTAVVPVRAYVGLRDGQDAGERAELAVQELERAGGLDRAVVVVATSTGSGWVNSTAATSLELLYGGDSAIVSMQYSYLPSWLSFLTDRGRAQDSGRALFDAVHARLEELPEADRPRLLVYGESLGSLGAEEAFSSLADVRAQTDGVLLVGPPHSNRLWGELVERRDPGTRQVAPTYAGGLVARFAATPDDLRPTGEPWQEPRVLYLQHASDPVVWWSPSLLLSRPDWLEERRGADVSPAMSWYPIVTFMQVSVDLAHSTDVPSGHGHDYHDQLLEAWAAVAAPEGWTDGDTARARGVLDE